MTFDRPVERHRQGGFLIRKRDKVKIHEYDRDMDIEGGSRKSAWEGLTAGHKFDVAINPVTISSTAEDNSTAPCAALDDEAWYAEEVMPTWYVTRDPLYAVRDCE